MYFISYLFLDLLSILIYYVYIIISDVGLVLREKLLMSLFYYLRYKQGRSLQTCGSNEIHQSEY